MLFAANYIKQLIDDGKIRGVWDLTDDPNVEQVSFEEGDKLRWQQYMHYVFKVTADDGSVAYAQVGMLEGLTENQPDDEPSDWTITTVVPQTKTVTITEYVLA